jgi:hypothetical protein
LLERLALFHRSRVERTIRHFSPVVSRRAGFNHSAFYEHDCQLAARPSSYWGVDRCLRINETIDAFHSRLFHVGVFSRSVDAMGASPRAPELDSRFVKLQQSTLRQFFDLLEFLGVPRRGLSATYFAGAQLGGGGDGRDRKLRSRHRFGRDKTSQKELRRAGIPAIGIASIANFDIGAFDSALVGPRVEIYFGATELATLVFYFAKLRRGLLEPIHFVGGYGVGLERLLAVLSAGDFLAAVPRYRRARQILEKRAQVAHAPSARPDVWQVIFGLEALAHLPGRLTRANAARARDLKVQIKPSIHNLALSFDNVTELYHWFRQTRADNVI